MSWTDFAHMIDAGAGATTAEWQNAINGNPNTPQDALKVAIMSRIIDPKDTAALERLCAVVIELAQRCVDRTEHARHYHDAAKRLASEKQNLQAGNNQLKEALVQVLLAHDPPHPSCGCSSDGGDCAWHRAINLVRDEYNSMFD